MDPASQIFKVAGIVSLTASAEPLLPWQFASAQELFSYGYYRDDTISKWDYYGIYSVWVIADPATSVE